MRSTELFRSCANEHVAAAAIACIGGALKKRVATAARRAGMSSGAYVSRLVADYDRKASPKRRKSLEQWMFRDEMPILAGLRHVVEVALEGDWDVVAPRSGASKLGASRPGASGEVLDKGEIIWSSGGSQPSRQGPAFKALHS